MRVLYFVALSITLAACGGSVAPDGEGDDAGGGGGAVAPDALEENCEDELEDFVAALEDLDSRLNIGLNYADYSERVGDARVAYDRVDVEELGPNCIEQVGQPAELAMNAYIRAYQTWNECVGDVDCDNDSISPDLQDEWASATELVEQASDALDR